ncbi:MAG: four helix bundle protein [Bacteroidota bacterium]
MEHEELKIGNRRVLSEKNFAFAFKHVNFSYQLESDRKAFIFSPPLLTSGTAIAASSKKAQLANFMYKFAINYKEAHKTCYWKRLVRDSKLKENVVRNLISDAEELKTDLFLLSK